jgi:uncharacterized damage-inducible protein DinB
MRTVGHVLGGLVLMTIAGAAQQPQAPAPPTSLVAEVKGIYAAVQGNITKAVAQYPEKQLTWQPTPEVRTWARLIAHIVDDNNGACFALAGEPTRPERLDAPATAESAANKMTKAALEKAMADSAARCEKAFAAVSDAVMMERNGTRSKIGTLIYNTSHINEHYGNIVTYMRINGLVPPSSQPATTK